MTDPDIDSELWRMTASDEVNFVNHNDTDYSSFNDFQRTINERFEKLEQDNLKKTRKANLELWDSKLAPRWKNAILPKIDKKAARVVEDRIDKHGLINIYLQGSSGSGKTFIAYAALKRLIGIGALTPSQIKILSEEELMGFAMTGFEGRARFEKIFNSSINMYLLDGVGNRSTYSSKEIQIWEQLINHIYDQSLNVIFTSNISSGVFAGFFSDSAVSKLSHLLDNGGVINVEDSPQNNDSVFKSTNSDKSKAEADKKVHDLFS